MMGSGDTKTERMLYVLGNGGTGEEFRSCCNTKAQQYLLDAINRVNALDTRLNNLTLLTISQTDYDNLQSYDANTLYIITGE